MVIKNLTGHVVRIMNSKGEIVEFQPEGLVCRTRTKFDFSYTLEDENGIYETVRPVFDGIVNLPPPKDGVFYIVSNIAFSRIKGRRDVLAPDTDEEVIETEDGRVYAVKRFLTK